MSPIPPPNPYVYWPSLKDRSGVETCQRTRDEEVGRVRNAFPALPLLKTGARYTLGANTGILINGQLKYTNRVRTPISTRGGTQPQPKHAPVVNCWLP
jgi:hypothetical protein